MTSVSAGSRQVAGEGGLGRRDREELDDRAALCLDRGGEEVAVVVAEGVVGIDHRHLLAEVRGDPGRHRLDLALHVGDAGLQRPAVEAGGDVVALGADEVGMRSSPARGALPMTTWEKRVPKTASTFCVGEAFDDLGAALGVGAVVLEQDSTGRPAMPPSALISREPRSRCARTSGRRRRRCRCGAAGSRGGSARTTGPGRSRASSPPRRRRRCPSAARAGPARRYARHLRPPPLRTPPRSGRGGFRRSMWGAGRLVHGISLGRRRRGWPAGCAAAIGGGATCPLVIGGGPRI